MRTFYPGIIDPTKVKLDSIKSDTSKGTASNPFQNEKETNDSTIIELEHINGKSSNLPKKPQFATRQSSSGVPKFCELMYVWSTSAVGLDLGKSINKNQNLNNQVFNRGHNKRNKMSMTEDMFQTPRYLSWRKMHLSRAKLKASSKTSALLSGFAMVAMVELQLTNESSIPSPILVIFAVITTLLVAVHMLALMISTYESPHERLHWYIEIAWAFSTLLGLLLFLAEIAIICWLKFYNINKTAAWSACVVLVPILFVFLAFAIHFYRSLVAHKYEISMKELKKMNDQIGDVTGNKMFVGDAAANIQIV
ncbi:hypothetical protein GWI33_002326 [Rhynchophorus ferrugineus]|uniref:Calcium release-activated calcium channel protein 1 n=1 Tax=Rhynchophorus ferrugineus TaxID=354439 RepID=A0A834IPJ0_RHYFE|nr:hypothetical protein GWI33_002326 [Rhynchophorus ferrugineus]